MVRRGMAVLLVLLVSIALMGFAQAVSGVAPTNLTIQVRDGRVFGILTGRPVCRAGQPIELVVNGVETATATTNARGRYSFTFALDAGSQVRTEFEGAIVGIHPDTLVCRGSTSKAIVVRGVRPGGGSSGGGPGGAAGGTAPVSSAGGTAFSGREVVVAAGAGLVALATGVFLIMVARRPRRSA